MPWCRFLVLFICFVLTFILLGILWNWEICSLVSDKNLGKFSEFFFNYFFWSFSFLFLFCSSDYMYVKTFVVVAQSFFSLCSLYFSVFKANIYISSSSEILPLAMCSLLRSPSKALFISVTMFLISSFYFLFFLRIPISLLILSICSCMLSALSIRALSLFIIVVLNSSLLIPTSGSDIYSFSSNSDFCLLVCLIIFFLLGWTDDLQVLYLWNQKICYLLKITQPDSF